MKSFRIEVERILNSRVTGMLTWDQALFSFRFLKLINDRRANSKFDQTFLKSYISTVTYPSLESYSSFERAYNKRSKKIFSPLEAQEYFTEKIYKTHFRMTYAKIVVVYFFLSPFGV